MKMFVMLFAAGTFATACKKKEPAPAPAPTGSAVAMAGSGSAMAGSAAAKPVTGDELVTRFHDCWAKWSAAKWDDLAACYAPNAVWERPGSKIGAINGAPAIVELDKSYRAAFPNETAASQLVLVNGNHLASVVLISGKQTGSLKLPNHDLAPTNAKFGLYTSSVVQYDDAGKIAHQWDFEDMSTLFGQLKPSKDHPVRPVTDKLAMPEQVAVAKNDMKESANLTAFKQMSDSFNKHDLKSFTSMLADNVVWSEQAMPKDQTKKDLESNLPQLWKAFSDLKFDVTDSWAAGDYVVATETFDGTNDGDMPAMKIKKTGKKVSLPFLAIHKLENGRVTAAWMFFEGGGFESQLGMDTKLSKN
ncbi:MAG TPA: nuclear transport factor 2 family protein [Kofleriaceae bacterium]|jgi:predicted ester cyclase